MYPECLTPSGACQGPLTCAQARSDNRLSHSAAQLHSHTLCLVADLHGEARQHASPQRLGSLFGVNFYSAPTIRVGSILIWQFYLSPPAGKHKSEFTPTLSEERKRIPESTVAERPPPPRREWRPSQAQSSGQCPWGAAAPNRAELLRKQGSARTALMSRGSKVT